MQAKDVTDEVMIAALTATRGRHGVPAACMIKRGVITGCTCGCRGDFELARAT